MSKFLFFASLNLYVLTAFAQTNHVVISQLYGAGGNTNAPFKNDFVELFNPTASTVNLTGYSLQYAGATSTNWSSNKVDLSGSISPGKYFLVQLNGGSSGSDLPTPDQSSTAITMSATAGKVALVSNTIVLSGNCPDFSFIIDFVGYGTTADCKETAVAPAPSTATAIFRAGNGCIDSDNNSADFTTGAPSPRNSSSSANFCNLAAVSISSITALPFCVDGINAVSGSVQYNATGTFSNATFTAYLSDANGSFTGAVAVGFSIVSGTNPTGSITLSIPATSVSSTNYRLRIDASNPSVTGNQSGVLEIINGAKNVSSFSTSPNSGEITLLWTNPAGCFDEMMVVVKEGSSISAMPAGDGSAYTASLNFNGNGTAFDGGKVVYKGITSGQTVTSLTNGTTYYFKIFTRRGTQWSSGVETTDKPRLMPKPGEILINQLSPGYNGVTDEYIELVNTTSKTFDLSELAIRYEASSGNSGVAGGTLSGTLQPNSFWLLSSKSVVTVGQTSNLSTDGLFADGFAAENGQVALIRKTDNVILDALGYGTIAGGDYTEGSAALTPSSNSGLKRIVDGADNNNNSLDFSLVSNVNIDLRNSASRLANTDAIIVSGSYSKLVVTGNSSVSGNVEVTDKLVMINGILSLNAYNLSAWQTEGGSASAYIQTNGSGSFIINNIATTAQKFAVGNSTYNPLTISNGGNLNWSVRLEDNVQANTNKTVWRTWQITPSATPVMGANLLFEYNDGDASQLSADFNKSEDVLVWNFHANSWQSLGVATTPTGIVGSNRTVALTNCTQFSPFAIANISSPLPVNFTNVKALQKTNGIEIVWSNLTESNIDRYEVERSSDAQSFLKIKSVIPYKNNAGRADYTYLDANPVNTAIYYRIKAIEKDAQVSYSRVLALSLKETPAQLIIVPNPANGHQINFRADNLPAGFYQVHVYNTSGQVVYSHAFAHVGGSLNQSLNISPMKAGYYTLELAGQQKLKQSFVVF